MPQDNPPLLDKTMNTTESTPRNLADVLASGLANIANNVKPDASDIDLSPISGMSATNVQNGISELKQSLTDLSTADSLLPTAIAVTSSTMTNTGTLSKSIADYRLIILEIQPTMAGQKVFYPYIGNNISLQGNIIQSMSVYSMGNITINNKDVTVQFNACAGWNDFKLKQVYGFGKIN